MGSISDYIECPKCGNEAHQEFQYKTGEEHILCLHCGYSRRFYITNWDDKEDPQMIDEGVEWTPKYQLEEFGGHGAYRIRAKGYNAYEVGSFGASEEIEGYKTMIEARKDEIAHAEYTTVDENGTAYTTVLIQGDIESFEE